MYPKIVETCRQICGIFSDYLCLIRREESSVEDASPTLAVPEGIRMQVEEVGGSL